MARQSYRSSNELVAEAIRLPYRVKRVASGLRRRPPCESSARRVGVALREGRVDHWLAALLLSSIRHPIGFEIVCEMFGDPRLSYAGSHLASALIQIDPQHAAAQLLRFVEHASTQVGCDEAVWGLTQLASPLAYDALVRASVAGRLSSKVAAPVLVDWGIDPVTLENWLTSGRSSECDIACAVVAIGARRPSGGPGACQWTDDERGRLLELARLAVSQGAADPRPYVRTALRRPTRHRLIRTRVPAE